MGKSGARKKKGGSNQVSGDNNTKSPSTTPSANGGGVDLDSSIFLKRAHELKEEGKKRFQRKDFAGALDQYENALRASSSPAAARWRALKLVYDHDIRLARMPAADCSFRALREIVANRFPSSKSVLIKYKDSDGDLVTITSTAELRFAESCVDETDPLMLHLVEVSPEQEPHGSRLREVARVIQWFSRITARMVLMWRRRPKEEETKRKRLRSVMRVASQGLDVSIKEVDGVRKMEPEEAETNMKIMLNFLHCLKKQKLEELTEIQSDLQYIQEDINIVERRRIELYRDKERFSGRMRMLVDDPTAEKATPSSVSSLIHRHGVGMNYNAYSCQVQQVSGGIKLKDSVQSITPSALAQFQVCQFMYLVVYFFLFLFNALLDIC